MEILKYILKLYQHIVFPAGLLFLSTIVNNLMCFDLSPHQQPCSSGAQADYPQFTGSSLTCLLLPVRPWTVDS